MITIRSTSKNDLGSILELIQELATYEEMPNGPQLTLQDLERDGGYEDSSKPLFYSFVAEISNEGSTSAKIIGYTIAYITYTTTVGKSYFLEDIYVQPEHRKCGAGSKLFNVNVDYAIEMGCKQMLWHVLGWNQLARDFYHKLEADDLTTNGGLEYYRLDKQKIEELSGSKKSIS